MSRPIATPLLTLPHLPAPPRLGPVDDDDVSGGDPITRKRWYHYLPLGLALAMILGPHPSLFIVFVNYHYRIHHSLFRVGMHVIVIYTLTILAFSSLIVVLARDPGPVGDKSHGEDIDGDGDGDESFLEALLAPPDGEEAYGPGKWCKKCSAPKPERAHHCGTCGRCVLKMDHHCIWLGHKCIGHRTHASFVHFLCCVTGLSVYVAGLCCSVTWWAFTHPSSIDETTPLHSMFVAFYGIVISMVIGSFCFYHLYLVSTNQTTLESLSPFLLLRHIPPLPDNADSHKLSNPPLEHELSFEQRTLVRAAHRHIRLYDVGFKRNWAQVFGWTHRWGWAYRLAVGGGCLGDGRTFPRNPRSDEMLARLAAELVSADKDR